MFPLHYAVLAPTRLWRGSMADQPYANVEMLAAGVEHMQESWTLSAHSQPITSLCVHGVTLFSAGRDCQLILYDLSPTHERAPPEMLASFTLPRVAQSIAADRSRIYAATGSCDIDVLEWSEDEGMLIGDGEPLDAWLGRPMAPERAAPQLVAAHWHRLSSLSP